MKLPKKIWFLVPLSVFGTLLAGAVIFIIWSPVVAPSNGSANTKMCELGPLPCRLIAARESRMFPIYANDDELAALAQDAMTTADMWKASPRTDEKTYRARVEALEQHSMRVTGLYWSEILELPTPSASNGGPNNQVQCPQGQYLDSRSGSCVTPVDEQQARGLTTRNDLEKLRDSGDQLSLVEVHFAPAIDRTEVTVLLKAIKPTTVDAIGFYFPAIEGGYQVQAQTDSVAPVIDQLIPQARLTISARYAALGDSETALSDKLTAALDSGSEQYLVLRLHAHPSRLLAAWDASSNVAYIAIQATTN